MPLIFDMPYRRLLPLRCRAAAAPLAMFSFSLHAAATRHHRRFYYAICFRPEGMFKEQIFMPRCRDIDADTRFFCPRHIAFAADCRRHISCRRIARRHAAAMPILIFSLFIFIFDISFLRRSPSLRHYAFQISAFISRFPLAIFLISRHVLHIFRCRRRC